MIEVDLNQSNMAIPKVGVGVMIINDKKVLLGKRKNSHGDGEYAFPGGHLEYLESFFDCAKREVLEETNLEIYHIDPICVFNTTDYKPKHYIEIGVIGLVEDVNTLKVMEPDKCDSWDWYNIDELPKPMFKLAEKTIKQYKSKLSKNIFDI